MRTRGPARNQVRMHLERVLAVLEHVARADRLRAAASPAGAPARSRSRAARAIARAEDEAARLGAEDEIRLASARPSSASSVDRLVERLGSASSGMMSLKPTPGLGKSGTSRIFVLQVDGGSAYEPTCRSASRQKRRCESSCASSASACRSRSPGCRRSALRARSAGATTLLEQRRLAVGRRCGTCAGAAARSP